jgi:hypothetical protein
MTEVGAYMAAWNRKMECFRENYLWWYGFMHEICHGHELVILDDVESCMHPYCLAREVLADD